MRNRHRRPGSEIPTKNLHERLLRRDSDFVPHWLVLACLSAVALTMTTALLTPDELLRQLAISFERQPVGYTELYFDGANPVREVPNTAAQSTRFVVTFTIHNGQRWPEKYNYAVRAVRSDGTDVARASGDTVVPASTSSAITDELEPIGSQEAVARIDVDLVDHPEYISFVVAPGKG